MDNNEKLKLFISYSHYDEEHINDFIRHIAPLKTNGLISDWYDRKITAGKNFQNEINNNLEDADIICLFISANFLSSNACLNEKHNALALMNERNISVLPIILSPCGWKDDADISSLLALPTDGAPISNFDDPNGIWQVVYDGIKKIAEQEIKIKSIKIKDLFSDILQNTELLSGAHSQKETVFLDDIFVYPELSKFDTLKEYEKRISSEKLINNLFD